MEIQEERVGDALVLAPDGDLNSAEDCRALEQRLNAAIVAGTRFLVLDCARVGHLKSPALRALLPVSRRLIRASGRLVLCGMTAKVQKAFSISGLDREFSVATQRDAALRLVAEPPPAWAEARGSGRGTPRSDPPSPPPVQATGPAIPPPERHPVPDGAVAVQAGARSQDAVAATVVPPEPDPWAGVADRVVAALGFTVQPPPPGVPSTPSADHAAIDAAVDALLRALAAHAA